MPWGDSSGASSASTPTLAALLVATFLFVTAPAEAALREALGDLREVG
jgi:hypothetical protein